MIRNREMPGKSMSLEREVCDTKAIVNLQWSLTIVRKLYKRTYLQRICDNRLLQLAD